MQSTSAQVATQPKVTIIGDSTIDNKLWVFPGLKGNYLYDRLGFKRDDMATRIKKSHMGIWKTELSVIEHLTDILPTHQLKDYTNDGFTTGDCMHGGYRDHVFGEGTFSMFPHEYFTPMEAAEPDIKESQYIVLSVGGNDLREFLVATDMIKDPVKRKKHIEENFNEVLTTLKRQYIEIVQTIQKLNKDAVIILMTQYYPSMKQNNYNIYSLLLEIGQTLKLGKNPNDPLVIIHEIMKQVYGDVINNIVPNNIVVADITSSLNPFDGSNHSHQIEPSGIGGKKIAAMLKHVITQANTATSGLVYQFDENYFAEQGDTAATNVHKVAVADWTPRHPYDFISANCRESLEAILQAGQTYPEGDSSRILSEKIYQEASSVLMKLDNVNEITKLEKSLALAANISSDPNNLKVVGELSTHLGKQGMTFFSTNPQKTLSKYLMELCQVATASERLSSRKLSDIS
jgi:hypothetical protein